MARSLQSKTAWLRQVLLISTTFCSSIGPLSVRGAAVLSAENCTGPRTYDEYVEMMFGPGSGYGHRTRPREAKAAENPALFADAAPADNVQIQMNIHQVNFVHDVTQSYKIFVMQSEAWMDHRLNQFRFGPTPCMKKKFVNLKYNTVKGKMWMPDVYVVNSADNEFLKGGCFIYLNGQVICTTYHSYELTCSMDFLKMPFDEQHCHIEMRVFAGTAKEVMILPATMAKPIELPKEKVGTVEWSIANADVTTNILRTDAGTSESQVFFRLTLKRESGFYIKEVIVPTIGVILICWLSFFVTKGAVPARCAVTVIAFLTLTNQINDITAKLPRLATDVWLLFFLSGSRWFAFLTILEYGLVNTLTRYEEALNKAKAAAEKKEKDSGQELKQLEAGHADRPTEGELVQRKAKAVDPDIDSGPPGQQMPRESHQPGTGKFGKEETLNDGLSSNDTQQEQQQQRQLQQQQEQQQQSIQPVDVRDSLDLPRPVKRQSTQIIQKGVKSSWHGACIQYLLTTKENNMRVKDIDVDVFARWAYPIAYLIFFLIMIANA